MSDREFWHAVNIAASRTKGLPSWTSGGINVSDNFEGPKREDRLMVPFRVDISRVKISVCKLDERTWSGTARMAGKGSYTTTATTAGFAAEYAAIGLGVYHFPTCQPHPWKRADGSHIKAEWEE